MVASLSMTWVATRAAGYTAFALLTASVALGLLLSSPLRPTRWPRFATTELHRFVTLLTLLFIAIHVLGVAGQLHRLQPVRRPGAVHQQLPAGVDGARDRLRLPGGRLVGQ